MLKNEKEISREFPPVDVASAQRISRFFLHNYYGDFIDGLTANNRLLNTVRGRLGVSHNNVFVPAEVERSEELCALVASLITAIGREDINIAAMLSSDLGGNVDLMRRELEQMGKVYRDFDKDKVTLQTDINSLYDHSKSLLLVGRPGALPADYAAYEFGYQWPITLSLSGQTPSWQVSDCASIRSFMPPTSHGM